MIRNSKGIGKLKCKNILSHCIDIALCIYKYRKGIINLNKYINGRHFGDQK